MSQSFKPDGYSTVSPYLMVSDADSTIQFLTQVFDAVELRRFSNENGSISHAEVRLADSVVMIADTMPDWPAQPAHIHIYVPDVDAVYERALAAGAESVQPPTKKDDADRRSGVKDAGGTTWWIATKVD